MGTDIHGWIEIREEAPAPEWYEVVDVGILFDRNYSMFGSLFGVRNGTDFEPIAAGRGLPEDVSEEVKTLFESTAGFFHSPTWVSWAELKIVDWNERTLDGMAHGYKLGESRWCVGTHLDRSDPRRKKGETWVEEDVLFHVEMTFRVEAIARRQALGDSGQLVLDLMERLAKRYGEEGVRLVVYFDN